jgi:hypothetical protein
MGKLTNFSLTDQADSQRTNFQGSQPFPHIIIDNFLEPAFASKLLAEFPAFDEGRAIADNGRIGGKSTKPNMRELAPSFQALDVLFSSKEFLSWMSRVTGIPDLLYDADYFGGGTHENLNGQDMSVHVDFNYHPTQGWHRRLNALIYLNPTWEENWGGQLELWKNPWDPPSKNNIVRINPIFNRLVIFPTTEDSWHGFEAVKVPPSRLQEVKSRRSIAIYLYSKERPAAETSAMHTTVYYERPLPESIRPEKVISRADWDEMKRLTARRDDLLKLVYAREGKLNSLIADLNKRIHEQERELRLLQPMGADDRLALAREQSKMEAEIAAFKRTTRYFLDLSNSKKISIDQTAPLVFAPSSSEEYTATSGLWRIGFLTAGMKVKAVQKFQLKPKIWALVRVRDSDQLQLVFLAKEFQSFFLAHQAASPGSLLVPREAVYAQVTAARNQAGDQIALPGSLRTRLYAIALAWLFLTVHTTKNMLLGRVHGRWIWKLSVVYRRLLKTVGIHVPVIPPPSRL